VNEMAIDKEQRQCGTPGEWNGKIEIL